MGGRRLRLLWAVPRRYWRGIICLRAILDHRPGLGPNARLSLNLPLLRAAGEGREGVFSIGAHEAVSAGAEGALLERCPRRGLRGVVNTSLYASARASLRATIQQSPLGPDTHYGGGIFEGL